MSHTQIYKRHADKLSTLLLSEWQRDREGGGETTSEQQRERESEKGGGSLFMQTHIERGSAVGYRRQVSDHYNTCTCTCTHTYGWLIGNIRI